MNLKAYQRRIDTDDICLFGTVKLNKAQAKRYLLNHGMLAAADYVIFKDKRYTIGQVYKWRS